jgi:hypothetical protein
MVEVHEASVDRQEAVWRLMTRALDDGALTLVAKAVFCRMLCTSMRDGWGKNQMFFETSHLLPDGTEHSEFRSVIAALESHGYIRVKRHGPGDWSVFVGPLLAEV